MTHPMTGQPATEDERTDATQKANAELSKMLENGDIERGFNDDEDEQTDEEKIQELRDFRQTARDEGNDELGVYGEPQTDDETEMVVTDNDGETTTYTRDEWDNERGTRMRTWKRMERDGLMFVRVARWFNNEDMNRVQTGRGFYGHKVGETDKALKFEVPGGEGLSAQAETVWVPKKAVRTHELI
jgi:hypothetical protein